MSKGMSRTKSLLDLEERMVSMEEWRAEKEKEEEDEDEEIEAELIQF